MWTKLVNGIKVLAGTLIVLTSILIITLLGVAAFSVAVFFFWGIFALIIIVGIVFFIWDIFNPQEGSPKD